MKTHTIRLADKMGMLTTDANAPTTTAPPTNIPENFLDYLLHTDMDTEEYQLLMIKSINRLTGQVAFNLDLATRERMKNERNPEWTRPGELVKQRANPNTLDQRNEQDEFERGKGISNEIKTDQGFDAPIERLHLAKIFDGLRFYLYGELEATIDLPDPDAILVRTPAVPQEDLYGLPISIEQSIRFTADRVANPTIAQLKQRTDRARMLNRSEDMATKTLREDAQRDSRGWLIRMDDVLAEAESLDYRCDSTSDWMSLPREQRERFVVGLRDNLLQSVDKIGKLAERAFTQSRFEELQRQVLTLEMAAARLAAFLDAHAPASASENVAARGAALKALLGGKRRTTGTAASIDAQAPDTGAIADMVSDPV